MLFRRKQPEMKQKKLVRAREYVEQLVSGLGVQLTQEENPLRRLHLIINGDPEILRNLIGLINKYAKLRALRTFKLPLYRKYDNMVYAELLEKVIRPAIDKYEQQYGELLVPEDDLKEFINYYFKVILNGWTLQRHMDFFGKMWEKTLGIKLSPGARGQATPS